MTTRSSSESSQQEAKNRPTISGRIENGKKTTKDTTKSQVKVENPMSAAECEAETILMRQISIGQVCLQDFRLTLSNFETCQC